MRKIVLVAIVSALMIGTAYATTVANTTRVLDALLAGSYTVTARVMTTDHGVQVFPIGLSPAGSTVASPTTFSSSLVYASTGVTSFDWVLNIQLNATTFTNGGEYSVTAVFNNGGNPVLGTASPAVQTQIVYVATGTVTPNTGVFCFFDIGSATLQNTFVYSVTVQHL